MKSAVWIPSKSRPNPSFSQALSAEGIDHVIWVEPQDHEKYAAHATAHTSFRVLEMNDQGVTYVRQKMLDAARNEGVRMWMMDDDINKFFRLHPIREGIDKARRRILIANKHYLRFFLDTQFYLIRSITVKFFHDHLKNILFHPRRMADCLCREGMNVTCQLL